MLRKCLDAACTRRRFFAFIASLFLAGCGNGAKKESTEPFILGELKQFAEKETYLSLVRVVVYRDKNGLRAIRAVCTHQSCALRLKPNGFLCPCHGSRFTAEGLVTSGPARKPLTWHKLSITEDQQLLFWPAEQVEADWRMPVPLK